MKNVIDELNRRLDRLKNMHKAMASKHSGNEDIYTYFAGYDLGYLEGKIAEIENTLDIMNENKERNN